MKKQATLLRVFFKHKGIIFPQESFSCSSHISLFHWGDIVKKAKNRGFIKKYVKVKGGCPYRRGVVYRSRGLKPMRYYYYFFNWDSLHTRLNILQVLS